LSENHEFAQKVEDAGIAFIGPRPETIDALGDKTKARTIAMQTEIPVVPGTPGPVESYDKADDFIKEYGFPVIIKAAMGGGGRGMRVVRDQESFKENFERAVSEAKSAFGDGTVFIEREWLDQKHAEADGQQAFWTTPDTSRCSSLRTVRGTASTSLSETVPCRDVIKR
jgi:pyruvate carboxylase